jgi:hypothetical protein
VQDKSPFIVAFLGTGSRFGRGRQAVYLATVNSEEPIFFLGDLAVLYVGTTLIPGNRRLQLETVLLQFHEGWSFSEEGKQSIMSIITIVADLSDFISIVLSAAWDTFYITSLAIFMGVIVAVASSLEDRPELQAMFLLLIGFLGNVCARYLFLGFAN